MKQENDYKIDPKLNTDPKNNRVLGNNVQEEDLGNDMEGYESDFEDIDSSDEYGSSGEKYGWYNGFSDDAIDDAFDGEPEATWNVD
jgi:hypothetical protein